MKETVLYYSPGQTLYESQLKGVLVRMGIRIKNIKPEQVMQTVGYLAGIDGYETAAEAGIPGDAPTAEDMSAADMEEEMLVMKGFTSRRIDELLMNLRKAGVPKISLKAVVTESNCPWTFCRLYKEILEEHRTMSEKEKTKQ